MNRLQLRTSIKNFINETDTDEQIDSILNDAIQYAYKDLSKIDRRVTSGRLIVRRGMITLPEDLLSIESITPALGNDFRKVGNTILTSKTGTFNVIYTMARDTIGSDTEELDLHTDLFDAVILYGAVRYYDYRKKTEQSQWLMQQYEKCKSDFVLNDVMYEVTQDVYSDNYIGGDSDE